MPDVRLRPVLPATVHQILLGLDQADLPLGQRLLGFLLPRQAVHARIETHPGSRAELLREPFHMRGLYQVVELEKLRVNLLLHLHGVASVHKHGGAIRHDDADPSRTGKITRPAQALVVGRQVFTQILIRSRHNQRIEPLIRHGGPEPCEPVAYVFHISSSNMSVFCVYQSTPCSSRSRCTSRRPIRQLRCASVSPMAS